MSLPPPAANQPYIKVSALEGGHVKLPLSFFLQEAASGELVVVPAISFLLRHTSRPETFLFDLGIRPDVENLPLTVRSFAARMEMTFEGRNVPAALAQGGLQPDSIAHVVISHVHFDHTGDARAFPNVERLGAAFLAHWGDKRTDVDFDALRALHRAEMEGRGR